MDGAMKRKHEEIVADDGNNIKVEESSKSAKKNVNKIPPYDANKEPLPNCKTFTQEFEDLTTEAQEITDLLLAPFKANPYRNDVLEGLFEEIQRRTSANTPERHKIALVGEMKAGKSMVINSILGMGLLARSEDSGSSCTWVVNEFCSMLPWQQKPFAAEIHLFNEEEREEIIKAFVANYYRACSKDDDDEPETNKATTVEEHATMKSVVDAFVALFNTKPEFADEAKAHKFLASAVSETDENIIDKLVQYSDEVVAKGYRDGDQHVRQEESTPQSLLWQLAPFQHTVQLSRGQPMQCMWPFVNHIRFGGESNVLKNGIDLVDLPGLSDANQTRVQNANNHLRDCTHYMIVAEIGRAKDDKFIREHLQRSCKSRGPGRTILVLTHADRIDPSTEVFGSLEQEELLGTLQDELSALERKREDLEDRLAQEDSHSMTLERELRTCRAEYQEKESQRQELRIEMRSAEITEEIRKQYQDLTHDPSPLPVFCVGNEAYKKHQAGYRVNDRNAPALSVEGTRIPALRRYLLLAPGHGKLNDARHQALVQIPTAIKCASLYAHRIHMARKDVIEKIVVEPFAHTDTFVNAAFDWAKGQVETHILAQWRSQERDFSARARDLCKTWARLDTGTKLGLYNRNGHRKGSGAKVKDKSKKKETISWNGELVQMKSKEICKWFENFEGATCSMAKQIRRALNLLFNNMGSDIESDPDYKIMVLHKFMDYLRTERKEMIDALEQRFKKLRKDIG